MLGMPTLIQLGSVEENAELCSELGLDFVELNMNLPYALPENLNTDDLKSMKAAHGIDFTIHMPEDIDFAAFSASIRKANIKFYREVCGFAKQAGIKLINAHVNHGIHFSLPDGKIQVYDKYKEDFLKNLSESMTALGNISRANGIRLCIENTIFPKYMEEAFKKINEIKNIYFTWDIGHDAQSSYRAERFFIENIKKVKHMHIHDFDGINCHQTLFTGVLDIKRHIEFAASEGISAVIEVKAPEQLRKSISRLQAKDIIKN